MNKKYIIAISIMLLLALVIMGCGTSTTSTTAPKTTTAAITTTAAATTVKPATTAPASTTAATTAATSTTAAAVKPTTGGTLRIGSFQEFPQIGDPPTQTYSSDVLILDTVLESLLNMDSQGTPVPWLATSWKMDTTALTLTLNLKQGIKFSDGTDFNATAVQWNLNRCIAAKNGELANVKSVDVVDPYTVQLNLTQPDGLLTTYLAGVRGLMQSPTAFQQAGSTDTDRVSYVKQHPTGTGPFTVQSRKLDVQTVLVKNPNYWQPGQPYLDQITYTPFADPTTLMADFKAGNQDVMETHQLQDVQTLSKTNNYNIVGMDVNTITGLEGDSNHPDSPWANIKVRQAAEYAIDGATLAQAVGYGFWQPTNQFDIPSRWGYNPSVVGYPFNVAKAKQMMIDAGYPNGFTTNIYGMAQYNTQIAALQGYLQAIGITAQAQIVTPEKRVQMFSSDGWNGIWIWECTVQPSSLVNMGRNFTAANAPKRMISCNVPAAFSAEVAQATAATDLNQQKALTWQLQKDMIDNFAFVTLYMACYYPVVTVKKFNNYQVNTILHTSPAQWWLAK